MDWCPRCTPVDAESKENPPSHVGLCVPDEYVTKTPTSITWGLFRVRSERRIKELCTIWRDIHPLFIDYEINNIDISFNTSFMKEFKHLSYLLYFIHKFSRQWWLFSNRFNFTVSGIIFTTDPPPSLLQDVTNLRITKGNSPSHYITFSWPLLVWTNTPKPFGRLGVKEMKILPRYWTLCMIVL